jgi:hypothetical protein
MLEIHGGKPFLIRPAGGIQIENYCAKAITDFSAPASSDIGDAEWKTPRQ